MRSQPPVRLSPLLFVSLALGCAGESEERTGPEARPVRIARAKAASEPALLAFPGQVRADRRPALGFQVPGRIVRITVDVGDRIEAGQLVAALDPGDFEARVANARAEVSQARAEAARTRRIAERNQRLFDSSAVSEAERDQSRDVAESAAARLESAEQRLALARRELGYTRLVASSDGVVVERLSDPGATVRAGQSILRTSGTQLEIRVDLPESALSWAEPGARAEVRLPALGTDFLPAEVIRVARGQARGDVLYPVFLELPASAEKLVPGLAAEVRLLGAENDAERPVVAVPPTAVVGDPEGPFVWVLEARGEGSEQLVARRRSIELLRLTGTEAVVAKGLEAGERVATAGATYLHEGATVRAARMPPLVFEGMHRSSRPATADLEAAKSPERTSP